MRDFNEAEFYIRFLVDRLNALEPEVRDHSHRFDTLQSPWWKRMLFKLNGWPWYDLNGSQANRPWHRWIGR